MNYGLNNQKMVFQKIVRETHAQHKSLNLHQQQHWTGDNKGEHSPTNPVSDNATELVKNNTATTGDSADLPKRSQR